MRERLRRFAFRHLRLAGISSCLLLACIAPGSAAENTTQPATTILYDQPIADSTARLVVSARHITRPTSDVFSYGSDKGTCELDEIRVEIQQRGYEPVLASAYTCANSFAGNQVRKQPPTVLSALVSHGRVVLAMAGWNAVGIWEVNLSGEDPPVKWRVLGAFVRAIGGVNWYDNTRVEVKLKLDHDGHLMVGVRDKSGSQPQPFSWYEEELGTWALGFKAVDPQ